MLRLLLMCACVVLVQGQVSAEYDPLAVTRGEAVQTVDLTVSDAARSRDVPVLVYLPSRSDSTAVVLFSHGLGGSRKMGTYLGEHWARRGYVCVFVQHPGSDDAIWRNAPPLQRMQALREAASLKNFQQRVRDIPAVLDQLAVWNREAGHVLQQRLNLEQVGMSGHSFGAVTTQAVSGQTFPLSISYTDPRIVAAIAMSPSVPQRDNDPQRTFGKVQIPWLLLTGTRDTSPINNTDVASRLGVFPALPAGDKYELVLHNAEHSAFTDRPLPGDKLPRNPRHHRSILAVSTAFWDAYLKHDAAAQAWLQEDGPQAILEPEDRWQKK